MRELFQAYWMMISKTLATYRYLSDTNSVKASGSIIWMLLPLRNLSEVKNRRYKYVTNCTVNITTTKTSQIKVIKVLNDKITHSVVRYRSCARSPLLITDILLNLKSLTKREIFNYKRTIKWKTVMKTEGLFLRECIEHGSFVSTEHWQPQNFAQVQ